MSSGKLLYLVHKQYIPSTCEFKPCNRITAVLRPPSAAVPCSTHAAAESAVAAADMTAFQEEAREAMGFLCAADRSRRAHAVRESCFQGIIGVQKCSVGF